MPELSAMAGTPGSRWGNSDTLHAFNKIFWIAEEAKF